VTARCDYSRHFFYNSAESILTFFQPSFTEKAVNNDKLPRHIKKLLVACMGCQLAEACPANSIKK